MPARVDLASASSPAIRTVVVSGPTVPAARVPAKVVLKALSTRESGRAAAISAAAELSAGTTRESKVSKFSGLVMSTTILPASCSPRCGDDVGDGRVGDGEDDDVAGDRRCRRRSAPSSWTVWPPLAATAAMAWPMLPVPMMVRFAMVCSWRWWSNRFGCCFK